MGNVDLDKDAIIAMIWKEDVREKKNMDGVSMEKKCFYGHLKQYETEYVSPERGSQVKCRNRQGYQQRYQQGGSVYNIDYDRKPPHMIDHQLRQDTRIHENMNRELREEIIREVEERITFLVQSLKTQQVQNMTPPVPSARCSDATISTPAPSNGATGTAAKSFKIKKNTKEVPKKE